MLQDDFEAQKIAARRIWTDWDILENKEVLDPYASIIHDLLVENEEGRHTWHFLLALGCMNYEPAIPDILQFLVESNSDDIRGFAAEALARFSGEMIPDRIITVMWDILEEKNPLVVKVNTLRAFKTYFKNTKDQAISLKLLQLLDLQEHAIVVSEMVKLVGAIGSTDATPWLFHFMVTRRKELAPNVAANALDAIAKKNDYPSRKELIEDYADSIRELKNM